MFKRIETLKSYAKDIKVLYVEDDDIARKYTSDFLYNIFENLIVAVDGEDGFNQLNNNAIDIVISDINMPKLNGVEMLKKIKKVNPHCHTVILSQYSNSDILIECIQLYIDDYVLKPLDFEKLLNVLEKSIEKFKLEYEAKNHKFYLEQYLSLIDKTGVISKTNTEGIITYVNESFCKISGYKKEELIGQKHNIIRHHENTDEIYQQIWNTIKTQKKTWEGIIKNKSKNGNTYYAKTIITPIKDIKGNVVEYLAVRDSLDTVLDDKEHLFEQIEKNDLSILVLLQINEFEMLEKFYTIPTVDQVEKNFAFNLLSYLPFGYTFENVYSIGNGTFALLTKFNDFNNSSLNINTYLNSFVENVKNSNLRFDNMEFDINITVSYTIGKFRLYEDAKEGLENALHTLTFSNDSSIIASKEAKENLDIMKTVKIALENCNIVSYFQPIINNKTKEVEKYESLVRLINEKGEILSPFYFLSISKKGNYYNEITKRVLENSFKILHTINTKLSINISAQDIEKDETRHYILTLLEQYSNDAHRIIFELLEDENIKDFNIIKDFISTVKAKGVQIAIDDFGAGYSNFQRILEFEPNILKIDGSLVKNIEHDMFSRNIIETIVLFAQKQNIETIAEYVENESIFNILNEIGVDYSQGFYFGKPKKM